MPGRKNFITPGILLKEWKEIQSRYKKRFRNRIFSEPFAAVDHYIRITVKVNLQKTGKMSWPPS
jgi:hypothetical protein